MNIDIGFHNVTKVAAFVGHGEQAHWVDLRFDFVVQFGKRQPTQEISVFFNDAWMADALAGAINSINAPRVAANTVELMQQLRDSVALCDAERAP